MDAERARELLRMERERIEQALNDALAGEMRESEIQSQQPGEREETGTPMAAAELSQGMIPDLQEQLQAVRRAEERLAEGRFGLSVESGEPIPDGRLEANPLAERTVEEQQRRERLGDGQARLRSSAGPPSRSP